MGNPKATRKTSRSEVVAQQLMDAIAAGKFEVGPLKMPWRRNTM